MTDELSKNPYPQDHLYHDAWQEGNAAASSYFMRLIIDGKIQAPKQTGGMVSKDAVKKTISSLCHGEFTTPYNKGYQEAVNHAIKVIEAMPCSDDPRRMTTCHIAAITKARDTFANYAELHKAKGTKEAEQKAAVNYALSLEMDEALQMDETQ